MHIYTHIYTHILTYIHTPIQTDSLCILNYLVIYIDSEWKYLAEVIWN